MYAQLSYTLLTHRKTRRLKHLLSLETRRDAIGILAMLWLTALLEAEDGDLEGFTNEDLAGSLEWGGDPDLLVESLIKAGFVIRSKSGSLSIRDWMEFTGKALTIRAGNRERQRKHREKKKKTVRRAKPKGDAFPPHLEAGFKTEEEHLAAIASQEEVH